MKICPPPQRAIFIKFMKNIKIYGPQKVLILGAFRGLIWGPLGGMSGADLGLIWG